MLLRVDKRVGMWGYGSFWITFADKYPVDVDLDQLASETRERIIQCLNRGILFEVDENDNRIIQYPTPPAPIQKPVVSVPEEVVVQSDISLPVKQKLAMIELLELGVRQIKTVILETSNILQLMFALEHEKANKNRSTVKGFLVKRLEQLAPQSSITQRVNPYEAMVIEDEVEVVNVKMADLVVIRNDQEVNQSEEEQEEVEEMI